MNTNLVMFYGVGLGSCWNVHANLKANLYADSVHPLYPTKVTQHKVASPHSSSAHRYRSFYTMPDVGVKIPDQLFTHREQTS